MLFYFGSINHTAIVCMCMCEREFHRTLAQDNAETHAEERSVHCDAQAQLCAFIDVIWRPSRSTKWFCVRTRVLTGCIMCRRRFCQTAPNTHTHTREHANLSYLCMSTCASQYGGCAVPFYYSHLPTRTTTVCGMARAQIRAVVVVAP